MSNAQQTYTFARETWAPLGAINGVMADLAERQVDVARKSEHEVLNDCRRLLDRWVERRHRTVEAVATLAQAQLHARSPMDVMQAWLEWSHGSMQRLAEDARDQMGLSSTVARRIGSDATQAVEAQAAEVQQAARDADRVASETARSRADAA